MAAAISRGSAADTVRDVEAPEDVKALFARLGAGERVERTVLVAELERMLGMVRTTAVAFDDAVVLVRRRTALEVPAGSRGPDLYASHTLPDGAALLHTTWTIAQRHDLFAVLAGSHEEWLAEHDDARGIPVLRASQLDIARAASSYDDALYLLGADITWMPVTYGACSRSRAP